MARYSGGPETHAALAGPRPPRSNDPDLWKQQLLFTLRSIQNVRHKIDQSEIRTVKEARKVGMAWPEIAAALGVTRQAAWERWHEVDDAEPSG